MKITAMIVCLLLGLATAAQAAEPPRKALVATGAEVTLAPSARTAAQWTAQRPKVRSLRPRARGTFD